MINKNSDFIINKWKDANEYVNALNDILLAMDESNFIDQVQFYLLKFHPFTFNPVARKTGCMVWKSFLLKMFYGPLSSIKMERFSITDIKEAYENYND